MLKALLARGPGEPSRLRPLLRKLLGPRTAPRAKPPAAAPSPPANAKSLVSSLALSRHETFRKLQELAFGTTLEAVVPAEHAKIALATAGALGGAIADPRYAPRRPLLLPQLLRAVSDGETSRRELSSIIARDPSLVGSLLKLANSPFYRLNSRPVESIDRAVAVLGTQGVRSLIAAALVQPVFRMGTNASARFPEIVWEHSHRSAAAAEVHAAAESVDPFAAQLLALVTGLGAIVVYRVAGDEYASGKTLRPDATAIASLLDAHGADVALRIAASWELSERIIEALEDQLPGKPEQPTSALGRSLRFGLVVGALSVLRSNGIIDETTAHASLETAGGGGPRFQRMWARLTSRV